MRTASCFVASIILTLLVPVSRAQDTPPSKAYGGSRTSTAWIETRKGKVAVDEGVAWMGVKVYLSLMWDLIGTDEATGRLLWSDDVGAFWNEIAFKEVETSPGVKTWAVELRPGPGARQGSDLRQYHELKTGKRIPGPESTPAGKVLDVAPNAYGRWSAIERPVRRLLGTAGDWKSFVIDQMFAALNPPRIAAMDFEKQLALVISSGDTWNCDGIEASAWEDDQRILVRLKMRTFQTSGPDGGGQRVRPWGIFTLPRRTPFKPIVVERNAQGLIGGPAIWKEVCRFDAPGEAKAESAPVKQGR